MSRERDRGGHHQPSVVLATAGYDHNIRFWDANTGGCYRTLAYPDKQVNALGITSDKKLLAAAGNPHIKIYDIPSQSAEAITTYEGHTGNVTALGFQKDGKWMYTGSEDGTVKIWDLRAPGCQRDYESRGPVNTVSLHPNQGELISGDQKGNICFWDLAANACSYELVPEGDTPVQSVDIAADASLLVAANQKGHCYFWRPKSSVEYAPHKMLVAHKDSYILRCKISPDVGYLATTSSDKTTKLWNVPDLAPVTTLTGHSKWVWDCAFSDDSSYIITASSDCTAKLWEVASGDLVRTYSGHHKAVVTVALNDSKIAPPTKDPVKAAPPAAPVPAKAPPPPAPPAAAGVGDGRDARGDHHTH